MRYEDEIIDIISSVAVISKDEINIDDTLSTIGVDSLTLTQLIITLEDTFEIVFDDSDLDPGQLKNVSDVIELVGKYMK